VAPRYERTIGFAAQPLFPPASTLKLWAVFQLFSTDWTHPCTQGSQAANPNQNALYSFPGACPSTRMRVGRRIGVSGDASIRTITSRTLAVRTSQHPHRSARTKY